MRDWINILGGLAIFGAGLVWMASGGGWIALLVMLGGGYGASQASIRRKNRIDAKRNRRLGGVVAPCGHEVAQFDTFCPTCGAQVRAQH